jgi:DNA-binding MarR family transcriptional regulator
VTARDVAFLRLSGAVRQLFHQLRAVAETATPASDGFTASHRAVLESLASQGPQTVPALARARPVARQHIQVLVNDLAELGLVDTRPNPAHRRSPLVALTAAGARRFDAIRAAESAVLKSMRLSLSTTRQNEISTDLELLGQDLADWVLAHRETED